MSGFVPNDPGQPGSPLGGWQGVQWNFSKDVGVNAPDAWDRLNAVGRPGGLGVKVAVLDTGVAYATRHGFKRSPDLLNRFLKGYDFVDNDAYPDDLNGHGTHVASTIAETTGNGFGVTGLAYGARIMPVRVLDRSGTGDSVAISARHPLRRPQGREGHQPLVRVRLERHARPDPRHPRRAPLRPPQGRARDRRLGQLLRARGRLPGAREQRAVGRRDDRARLPGRLLELRLRARHRRPRRRPRRRGAGRPQLPPRRRARSGATSTR